MHKTKKDRKVVGASISASQFEAEFVQAGSVNAGAHLTALQRAILDSAQDRIHVFELVQAVRASRKVYLLESDVIKNVSLLVERRLLNVVA